MELAKVVSLAKRVRLEQRRALMVSHSSIVPRGHDMFGWEGASRFGK